MHACPQGLAPAVPNASEPELDELLDALERLLEEELLGIKIEALGQLEQLGKRRMAPRGAAARFGGGGGAMRSCSSSPW